MALQPQQHQATAMQAPHIALHVCSSMLMIDKVAAVLGEEALQRLGNAAACDLMFRWLRPVRSIALHNVWCVQYVLLIAAAVTGMSLSKRPLPPHLARQHCSPLDADF